MWPVVPLIVPGKYKVTSPPLTLSDAGPSWHSILYCLALILRMPSTGFHKCRPSGGCRHSSHALIAAVTLSSSRWYSSTLQALERTFNASCPSAGILSFALTSPSNMYPLSVCSLAGLVNLCSCALGLGPTSIFLRIPHPDAASPYFLNNSWLLLRVPDRPTLNFDNVRFPAKTNQLLPGFLAAATNQVRCA